MSARAFVDTNVVVYLFDDREPKKRARAVALLERLAQADSVPVVSTQVLQEAYVALTRKVGVPAEEALATLQLMEGASFDVQPVDAKLVWRAAARSAADRLSFWDALVVETARDAGCAVLYSEDLQDGQDFDGVRVANPFG
ncbi:MAG: PIN domain-containing protein [Steroidobacteraceae bacterium]|jgi:predicted nucleic acid-binding protein|nr:PIN domain-containing protein [Steroidobacteraceae bacterium]